MLWDQRRKNSEELAETFPTPDTGLCPLPPGYPFLPGPRGAAVTCWENLQNCYSLPPWVTHPGYSGVAWRQYVQAGMNGSEGLEEPCRRVTKPWQIQPITFFSWLTKDLTHGEAQTPKAEFKKWRWGRWSSSAAGGEPAHLHLDGVGSGRDWSFSRILFSQHF